jgi:hypothetical protein
VGVGLAEVEADWLGTDGDRDGLGKADFGTSGGGYAHGVAKTGRLTVHLLVS